MRLAGRAPGPGRRPATSVRTHVPSRCRTTAARCTPWPAAWSVPRVAKWFSLRIHDTTGPSSPLFAVVFDAPLWSWVAVALAVIFAGVAAYSHRSVRRREETIRRQLAREAA